MEHPLMIGRSCHSLSVLIDSGIILCDVDDWQHGVNDLRSFHQHNQHDQPDIPTDPEYNYVSDQLAFVTVN